MNLRPFGRTKECDTCGWATHHVRAMSFCEGICIPDGHNGFVDTRAAGDVPQGHLHVTCSRCGFQWLEHPIEPRFLDFGSGTPVTIHGREWVMAEAKCPPPEPPPNVRVGAKAPPIWVAYVLCVVCPVVLAAYLWWVK